MMSLKYELHYLDAWGSSILYPLSFISQSSIAGRHLGGAVSNLPGKGAPIQPTILLQEGGSWKPLVANKNWEMDTLASNSDSGEKTSSIH